MFVNDYRVPHDLLNFNLEFHPVEPSEKLIFYATSGKEGFKK